MDLGGLYLAKQAKSAAGEAHGICSSSGYSGKGFGLKYEPFTLLKYSGGLWAGGLSNVDGAVTGWLLGGYWAVT